MGKTVRDDIVNWIYKPENKDLLETLKLMKEASASEDWFDDLDEEQIESIERGRKDHKEGRTLDSRTFWEKHAP
jgi:hypothetical protein